MGAGACGGWRRRESPPVALVFRLLSFDCSVSLTGDCRRQTNSLGRHYAANASALDLPALLDGVDSLDQTEFFLQTGYYLKRFSAVGGTENLYVMCTNSMLVRDAIIFSIGIAFFQRVPAIIARTGQGQPAPKPSHA